MSGVDVAETGIDHLYRSKYCSISTGERTVLDKLMKLAESHPDEVELVAVNQDGSRFYHIPWKWIKISPPRQYTEEQRQAMRERFESVQPLGQQSRKK